MSQQAQVVQVSVSQGGVPKAAVRTAEILTTGVVGDKQNNTRLHGGPDRAVCLYSLEHILALQAEGHPIYAGSVGENLTIVGVDWGKMVPGSQWRLGRDVLLEITSYTVPCKNIRESFQNEEFTRISQKVNPGWSRVYARVLQEGPVCVGDVVRAAGS